MTTHLADNRIQDYAEDLLCREERAEIEAHLAGCGDCRTEVATVRALLDDLSALPAEVLPERDLRAGIAARIDATVPDAAANLAGQVALRRGAASSIGDRSVRSMRFHLAAAAVVLVSVTAGLTAMLLGGERPGPAAPAVAAMRVSYPGQDFGAVEARYAAATAELEAALESARDELPAETIALLERSLSVIDAALAETRAALRDDPGDPALPGLIMAAYEQKLDLLRRAADAS